MGMNNRVVYKTRKTAKECQCPDKSTGFEKVKNIIADKLRNSVEAPGEIAAVQDTQSGVARHGNQASEWLDQSAEYVRQFDYEQADARVREYVRQSPGRSLLIAGAVGLVIGAILRRR